VQLAAAYALDESSELELRAGGTTRHTDEDDTDASLSGTSFSYAAASDDSIDGGYIGADFRVTVQDRLNLVTDLKYCSATGDETGFVGRLKLEYSY